MIQTDIFSPHSVFIKILTLSSTFVESSQVRARSFAHTFINLHGTRDIVMDYLCYAHRYNLGFRYFVYSDTSL
jgi:hypothetical protein